MNKVIFLSLFSLAIYLTAPLQELNAQHRGHEYGKVKFDPSCSREAGEAFQAGLALLHHMMYEQAETEFLNAAGSDPDCAMAHWGIAMSVIHPLWGERPTDPNLKKGRAAVNKAKSLNPPTEREGNYIRAVERFYDNWENRSYPEQLAAFEEGYKQLHEAFPDDVDAKAFYALGHLATAPKEDKTFAHQKKAGAMLEELHERAPEHPGLFHYIIHAYDNPALAERAVEVARGYDKIAPHVPHALHMPSHIFVRRGIWPDVIDWNIRSADAALKQPAGNKTSMHYAHALDYLAYAHLQRGEDEKARKVLEKMNGADNLQENLAAAYAVAAATARYPLEREKWEKAAVIPVKPANMFPLERYPAAESIIYFARGIGAARSGNTGDARQATDSLDRLYEKLVGPEESYWAVLTDAQRLSVTAWLAFSEGEEEKALSLMKKAADTEDSVDKHPVTPGHVLPARELLGDMLLELDKPAEALKAYEASLEISANRLRSLYGAGRSAETAGNTEMALIYFEKLIELSADAAGERPQLERAKLFVARNQP